MKNKFRKIIAFLAISSFFLSNSVVALEYVSTLRPVSSSGMIEINIAHEPKSSSAGNDLVLQEIAALKDAINDYITSKQFRISGQIGAFLDWIEAKASIEDLEGLIETISKRGFRLVEQSEDELKRSLAEVDFRKHSDQEEACLLSRILYAAMDNQVIGERGRASLASFIRKKVGERKTSKFFRIALELAYSKIAIDNIKQPIKIAFIFAIYGGKDRMSRQSEHINGEDALRRKITQLEDLFKDSTLIDWQLITVDDGSPDDSSEFARDIFQREYPDYYNKGRLKVLYLDEAIKNEPLNPALYGLKTAADSQKGGSIEYGMDIAVQEGADIVIYTDTDISSHLGLAGILVEPIQLGDADVVIGSRGMPDSLVLNRPFTRKIKSWQDTTAYNRLVVSPLLPSIMDIKDTQNAFKGFRADVIRHILPYTIDKRFSFDTELLLLAREAGFRLKETGMPWVDTPERTSVTISQGIHMAKNILNQRRRFRQGLYRMKKTMTEGSYAIPAADLAGRQRLITAAIKFAA
jgi:glycosyltransferase involved in cell wall biosynthesis